MPRGTGARRRGRIDNNSSNASASLYSQIILTQRRLLNIKSPILPAAGIRTVAVAVTSALQHRCCSLFQFVPHACVWLHVPISLSTNLVNCTLLTLSRGTPPPPSSALLELQRALRRAIPPPKLRLPDWPIRRAGGQVGCDARYTGRRIAILVGG